MDYWNKGPTKDESHDDMESEGRRKEEAICAGKKRSAKERLGTKKSNNLSRNKLMGGNRLGQDQDGSTLEDMSIPQPGMPRTIPDLSPEVIKMLLTKDETLKSNDDSSNTKGSSEYMDEEDSMDNNLRDSDSPSQREEFLGEELAARLCEPKTE